MISIRSYIKTSRVRYPVSARRWKFFFLPQGEGTLTLNSRQPQPKIKPTDGFNFRPLLIFIGQYGTVPSKFSHAFKRLLYFLRQSQRCGAGSDLDSSWSKIICFRGAGSNNNINIGYRYESGSKIILKISTCPSMSLFCTKNYKVTPLLYYLSFYDPLC